MSIFYRDRRYNGPGEPWKPDMNVKRNGHIVCGWEKHSSGGIHSLYGTRLDDGSYIDDYDNICYVKDSRLHNAYGPATIINGKESYYLEGVMYNNLSLYEEKANEYKINELLE